MAPRAQFVVPILGEPARNTIGSAEDADQKGRGIRPEDSWTERAG